MLHKNPLLQQLSCISVVSLTGGCNARGDLACRGWEASPKTFSVLQRARSVDWGLPSSRLLEANPGAVTQVLTSRQRGTTSPTQTLQHPLALL